MRWKSLFDFKRLFYLTVLSKLMFFGIFLGGCICCKIPLQLVFGHSSICIKIPSVSFQKQLVLYMNKVAPIEFQEISAIDFLKVPDQQCLTKSQHNEPIKACKICLEEEILSPELLRNMSQTEAADHELIVPCECSGSMGYVHQKCIRTWIEKQLASGDSKRAQC